MMNQLPESDVLPGTLVEEPACDTCTNNNEHDICLFARSKGVELNTAQARLFVKIVGCTHHKVE
jgi:hypothetical protein